MNEENLQAGPVGFRTRCGGCTKDQITQVWIPWSPASWFEVANKEGRFLGVCCANISAVRDELITALRDNGWISAKDLNTVVSLLAEHGGYEALGVASEQWPEAAALWAEHDPENPFITLGWIWFAVRERLVQTPFEPYALDPTDPIHALDILSQDALALSMDLSVFGTDGSMQTCAKTRCALAIARIQIALRTLVTHMPRLAPAPFVGVVLVHKVTGTLMQGGTGGPLVFSTVGELLKVAQSDAFARLYEVRRCRVSLDEGLVLGEVVDVAQPEPPIDVLRAQVTLAAETLARERETLERVQKAVVQYAQIHGALVVDLHAAEQQVR